MNSCLQCGKEIPEGKKFCNSSCSAKYNNSRRVRKPWTEEQKKRIQNRGKQVCKYCGKETGNEVVFSRINSGVCEDCKPFVKFQVGQQLGLRGTPKEVYNQALQILEDLYEEGESTVTISQKLGLPEETVWYNLHRVQKTRPLKEAQKLAFEEQRRQIPTNEGGRYKSGHHTSWTGESFWYRSGWEHEFASQLDLNRIPYKMEGLRIRYWDSRKQEERVAIPDFYLPETNEIIEIKSTHTFDLQNMKDKFKAYKEQGYIPKLYLDRQFKVL